MLNLRRDLADAAGLLPALGLSRRVRQERDGAGKEPLIHHDALKEILARARFICDLDEAIARGSPVAIHSIDIDRFRAINDSMGVEAGDAVLEHAAQALQTVGGDADLRARIGGDTFALAQSIANPRDVTRTAFEIIGTLGASHSMGGNDVDISVCVGSAVAPAHGHDAATLLKSAETALTHAQGKGPGSRALFRPEMCTAVHDGERIEAILRAAATSERFELAFQPIRWAEDSRLAGFEALLRLPDRAGGFLPPPLFMPVAERLGLSTRIGASVIRHACAAAATWPSRLFVAVNLSPAQVDDGDLAKTVQQALDASGLAAERLELEIGESLFLLNADRVTRALAALKALGVTIVLDDFGAGYSSLSHLSRCPFDKLKTDQVTGRTLRSGDDQAAALAKAVVALGRSLGMAVAADGVATEAEADLLGRLGIDLLQGTALGRPLDRNGLPRAILQDCRPAPYPAETRHAVPAE